MEILRARRTAALVRTAWVLHQHRPRPRARARADVCGGVADRPRAFEIDVVLGRGCLQHPRQRLAARARARELWHLALRVVEAVAPVVERDVLLGKQLDDPVVDLPQLGQAHDALRRRRLVGDHDQRPAEPSQEPQSLRRPVLELHVRGAVGRFVLAALLVHPALVDHSVAIHEHRRCHPTDSHFAGAAASIGCDTSRCHTTAWNASVCGVRRAAGAGTTTHASASSAVAPSDRPTTPNTHAPTERANSTAPTTFKEMPCERDPPPTLKTSTASPARSRDARSHAAKTLSNPSSFVRAVSSETLSAGV